MTQRDPDFERALQRKIDQKTKPIGALGRMEELAAQVARLQNSLSPQMRRAQLTLFAGDHGLAAAGVSAYPAEVTRQMVLNFAAGGAAANVFCRSTGLELQVVNAGVLGGDFDHPAIRDLPLGDGTANALTGPAMTAAQRDQALAQGRDIGAAGDYDAMAFGEMGIGNTSSAALLAHKLTGQPITDFVGRGTGVDDAGLARKTDILTQAAVRTGALSADQALMEYGGFEIVMMTGAIMGAAQAGRVVLVDGVIATTAALAAVHLSPDCREAMIFAHHSADAGHQAVLQALNARPLLALEMRLGEGTGAALAWPLVKAAVAMLNEMASFDDAGVAGPT